MTRAFVLSGGGNLAADRLPDPERFLALHDHGRDRDGPGGGCQADIDRQLT